MNTKCACGGRFRPMPNYVNRRTLEVFNYWVCDKCDMGVARRARKLVPLKELVRRQPTASRGHQ